MLEWKSPDLVWLPALSFTVWAYLLWSWCFFVSQFPHVQDRRTSPSTLPSHQRSRWGRGLMVWGLCFSPGLLLLVSFYLLAPCPSWVSSNVWNWWFYCLSQIHHLQDVLRLSFPPAKALATHNFSLCQLGKLAPTHQPGPLQELAADKLQCENAKCGSGSPVSWGHEHTTWSEGGPVNRGVCGWGRDPAQ